MQLAFGRWALVVFGCALVAATAACGSREEGSDARSAAAPPTAFVEPPPDATREIAVISVRGMGEIRVELFRDRAPNTVGAFALLAGDAFYDGTTFHRIIPGSVIQGGDPNSRNRDPRDDGDGGADFQLKAEFNDVDHRRGIVAMARATGPDSARGQFFICLVDRPEFNADYTAFGRVIAGMDVVDRIAAVPRDEFGRRGKPDRPLEDVVIDSVRVHSADAEAGAAAARTEGVLPPPVSSPLPGEERRDPPASAQRDHFAE